VEKELTDTYLLIESYLVQTKKEKLIQTRIERFNTKQKDK
jgi:hypothetical protein